MKNPPAFPHVADVLQFDGNSATVKTLTQNGMTLRDYFAAKAMQSLLVTRNGVIGTNRYEYLVTEDSYRMADAMMKEREE